MSVLSDIQTDPAPSTRQGPATPRVEMERLPVGALATPHPLLRAVAHLAPSGYLARALPDLAPGVAGLLALMAPILVIADRRGYRRIAGHRTYAVALTLLGPEASIWVGVLRGRLPDETLRKLAAFGVFTFPLLMSLDATAIHQMDAAAIELQSHYCHRRPGRPPRDCLPDPAAGLDLLRHPLSAQGLARLCGIDSSTLRRRRARGGSAP